MIFIWLSFGLGKTATEIQQQIAAIQDRQVRSFGGVVSTLRDDLKGLQEQGQVVDGSADGRGDGGKRTGRWPRGQSP